MPAARLILASASPRRQSLLREAGYDFTIDPADIDEEKYPPNLTPPQIAEYLAAAKADEIAQRHPDAVTIGSDTVVYLGDQLLGKPTEPAHARWMLSTLSGSTHCVVTGVAVVHPSAGFRRITSVTSTVQMRRLTPDEIDRYVAGGQWQGKAGGYGIQDQDPFVTNMGGSLTNIVGLPMEAATELLAAAGIFPNRPLAQAATIGPT
jgi:septum formation protein